MPKGTCLVLCTAGERLSPSRRGISPPPTRCSTSESLAELPGLLLLKENLRWGTAACRKSLVLSGGANPLVLGLRATLSSTRSLCWQGNTHLPVPLGWGRQPGRFYSTTIPLPAARRSDSCIHANGSKVPLQTPPALIRDHPQVVKGAHKQRRGAKSSFPAPRLPAEAPNPCYKFSSGECEFPLLLHSRQDPPDVNNVLIFSKCYFGSGVNYNLYSATFTLGKKNPP